MKRVLLLATVIAAMALGSCSSGKKIAQADYQYQQWLAQQYQQQYQQQNQQADQNLQSSAAQSKKAVKDVEVHRELDDCINLADDPYCANIRQYGDATGFVESVVMDEAIMQAQERMAVFIESSIEATAKRFAQNVALNLDRTTMSRFRDISTRCSKAVIGGCKIIKRSIYDKSNGQVHIYVCIESSDSKVKVSKDVVNALSNAGYDFVKDAEQEYEKELQEKFSEPRSGESQEEASE